jgi:hypothetical protein
LRSVTQRCVTPSPPHYDYHHHHFLPSSQRLATKQPERNPPARQKSASIDQTETGIGLIVYVPNKSCRGTCRAMLCHTVPNSSIHRIRFMKQGVRACLCVCVGSFHHGRLPLVLSSTNKQIFNIQHPPPWPLLTLWPRLNMKRSFPKKGA